MTRAATLILLIFWIGPALSVSWANAREENPHFTTRTSDGVTLYATRYFGQLGHKTPLILLFHQGGSNGRAEYAPLVPWFNENGFRAIAFDQRSGGALYGETNRTKDGLTEGTPAGFCDAYADLKAALDYVRVHEKATDIIVWGSSYSGALVFRLAAEHPDDVHVLLAFSPASGGPMVNCRARMWVEDIKAPMLMARPASEMERESSREQKQILEAAGVTTMIVENGIHGSSMLIDERTEHDMSADRAAVMTWLKTALAR